MLKKRNQTKQVLGKNIQMQQFQKAVPKGGEYGQAL